jgi:hypothetical protein
LGRRRTRVTRRSGGRDIMNKEGGEEGKEYAGGDIFDLFLFR